MTDYSELVNDLRNADNFTADHKLLGICYRAADAIEFLIKDRDDLKEAAVSVSRVLSALPRRCRNDNQDYIQ